MLFMVVEHFAPGSAPAIYGSAPAICDRLRERGRGVPEGVDDADGWIDVGFGRCFQLTACDDARLLQEWVLHWHDLATFRDRPGDPIPGDG